MSDEDRLAEILGDWQDRRDRGELIDPEEVVRRHPDLADRLRARFLALAAVDEVFATDAAEREPPERIGGYRVLRELGAGGMGTVYLAEADGEATCVPAGEAVALKVLHPHLLSRPGFFKRFLREAELGRGVRHENVVRTLDVDAALVRGAQANFLVMEHVEGRTLADLLHELGVVPEALLREIGRQLSAGLAAIHGKGAVHRDLKPENAIITGEHRVRIMDLGVARVTEGSQALTREGQFAGSLAYAAPEQFGKGEVGPAADLYALGVLLYELATGRNPFRRDEPAATMRAHLETRPPPADAASPDLSSFVCEVLSTLLEKAPGDRFDSAESLLEVLDRGESSAWWAERERRRPAAAARRPRIPVRRDTNLYGREEELERLAAAWEAARSGRGRAVLVTGEAGIGKSRLVDAFLGGIGDGAPIVLYGSYSPTGGAGGLTQSILRRFGKGGLEEALGPYLAETPSLLPAFAALLRQESPPEGSAPLRSDALHTLFCHLLAGLAAERPLLWIVEDLHFASADSRAIVLSLARTLAEKRAMLLLTARPGVPQEEISHLSRLPGYEKVVPGRLGARQVIQLLRDAFRSEDLAVKLGGRIALKSDGIPFFVFEMIRGLEDGRFITRLPDGTYVETRVVDRIEVPSAVRDLVEARLVELSDEDRNVLDVAAVAGYEFDPDLVARVCEMKRFRLLQRLAAIERRLGVVRAAGDAYRFDHHQIQEVLYEDLPEGLRKECHTLLAAALADREGADGEAADEVPGPVAAFLADHHLRGSRPEEARPFLVRAVNHLAASFRYDEGAALAALALGIEGLLEGEPRIDLLQRRVELLFPTGAREECERTLEAALALAERIGNTQREADVRMKFTAHLLQAGRPDEAICMGELAIARAREAGDERLESMCTVNRGNVYMVQGKFEEARRHHERALSIAEARGDSGAGAVAHGCLAALHLDRGNFGRAVEHNEEFLRLAREAGDREFEGQALRNLAVSLKNLGRYEEAREILDRALPLVRAVGNRKIQGNTEEALGGLRLLLGEIGAARGHLERFLALSRQMDFPRGEAFARSQLASLLLCLGNTGAAGEHLERSREICARLGLKPLLATMAVGRARHAQLAGDADAAVAFCEEGLGLLGEMGHKPALAELETFYGELLASRGEQQEATRHFREAETYARESRAEDLGLVRAHLAARGEEEPGEVLADLEPELDGYRHELRMKVRFLLWRATGDGRHLEDAWRLLRHLRDHAPEEYRETMIENVPLHREIADAWKALDA